MSNSLSSASAIGSATQSDEPVVPRIAAFFDVDGTILDGNVVHAYAHLATLGLSPTRRALWALRFALWIPVFLAIDTVSRRTFNRVFYRHYGGLDVQSIVHAADETFPSFGLPRLLPQAETAVRTHQESGHIVAIVSGTTSFLAQPLADYLCVDEVFTAQLEVEHGRFTGRLAAPPLSDERKAEVVRDFAETHAIDLEQSHAYGDSAADLPMLRAVGHPVAVNPSRRLRAVARRSGWRVEDWQR